MTIIQSTFLHHWNYFLAIVDDLHNLTRYIEPNEANYGVFSLELARILLAAGSESDVLLKDICSRECPESRAESINMYMSVMKASYPYFPSFGLHIPKWGLELHPWSNWTNDEVPDWWTATNKVKHHRGNEFSRASLKNTLNSVGALYILNLFHYIDFARSGDLLPIQSIFRVEEQFYGGTTHSGIDVGINYSLQ